MYKPKVIDLCCGAGGFSEGFRQAGFEIILGIDIWGDALESFKRNHKCDIIECDIKTMVGLPDCDIIIGSPPCQSFSRLQNGRSEPDTTIINHVYSLVGDKPYVFENVWQSHNHFKDYVIKLPAYQFGVPQIRERLFASSHQFPMFPMRFTPMSKVFEGGLMTTVANTKANGKRWKTLDEACWTVDTSDSFRLDGQKLSIEQYKMLMGFPIDYELYGGRGKQIKQLGNAVCPPVSKAIAEGIKEQL